MELHVSIASILVLWCDNQGATKLVTNLVLLSKIKHIELDVHFIHEYVLAKQLQVCFIPSTEQQVDALSKTISTFQFVFLRGKLSVQLMPLSLRGEVDMKDMIM